MQMSLKWGSSDGIRIGKQAGLNNERKGTFYYTCTFMYFFRKITTNKHATLSRKHHIVNQFQ